MEYKYDKNNGDYYHHLNNNNEQDGSSLMIQTYSENVRLDYKLRHGLY
jgi:hypothetical protein